MCHVELDPGKEAHMFEALPETGCVVGAMYVGMDKSMVHAL